MKALPVKIVQNKGFEVCSIEEATHITLNLPGPTYKITLPIILKGKREGTGCWTWNGDTERPTLKPSVLTQSGCFDVNHRLGNSCWCIYNKEHPNENVPFNCFRCHSWINEGQVLFLSDCTHELKNQTLDLLELD